VAVAIVVVDGLGDSEQPTSANMVMTTRSVARRIVRMLAAADHSTVASTWLWLNVFTYRRMCEIVCGPGLWAFSKCLVLLPNGNAFANIRNGNDRLGTDWQHHALSSSQGVEQPRSRSAGSPQPFPFEYISYTRAR
jgi:hypothetical protein